MWTPKEVTALRDGVRKYGSGKWSGILSDSKYGRALKARSNVDLKVIKRTITLKRQVETYICFGSETLDRTNGETQVQAHLDLGRRKFLPLWLWLTIMMESKRLFQHLLLMMMMKDSLQGLDGFFFLVIYEMADQCCGCFSS